MASATRKSAFWQGFRDGAPFLLLVAPFALLFGVVATEAGLNVMETLAFSIVVIAGAAQFTALQLMVDHVPTLIVLISALAVNLRLAMYSASLTPHIGGAPLWQRTIVAYLTVDQTYTCAISAYERRPDWDMPHKFAYFIGASMPVIPVYFVMTVIGAKLGAAIPPEYALDFAVPITFLAMIAPMLRTAAHLAAALASICLALAFTFLPFNLGLLLAGLGGMMTGAQVELMLKRQSGK